MKKKSVNFILYYLVQTIFTRYYSLLICNSIFSFYTTLNRIHRAGFAASSAADAGIAISDGAEIAREIADITIAADDLREVVTLKLLSNLMLKRIHRNYRSIVGINSGLIVLGVTGMIQPTMSALLHNTSTLLISLRSMRNLLPEKEKVEL